MRLSWTTTAIIAVVVIMINLWFWGELVPWYIHYVVAHP